MEMFAVLVGQKASNKQPISNVELEQIAFNNFVGFIHVKNSELISVSSSGFKYLDGMQCLNTETGLLSDVVFKIVPMDSVKEKFDNYRYLDTESYGILKSGNNYFSKECQVKFSLYQQAMTDWNNFKNYLKLLKDVSESLAKDVSELCSNHNVIFNDPYNNDYQKGNRIYESTMYDLKTDTLFYRYGHEKIYKFEKFINKNVIECTVFNGDDFSETCELNLSEILSGVVKLGVYFKI